MNAVVRRRLEMAARARDFLRAHRTEVASEATALARLEELLARAETLAAQQQAGVVATRSATVQREELRRGLQQLLRFLVGLGVVATQRRPFRSKSEPNAGEGDRLITCRAATGVIVLVAALAEA
jgi:hypothetical protein